jgi:hypothetical protein
MIDQTRLFWAYSQYKLLLCPHDHTANFLQVSGQSIIPVAGKKDLYVE